MESGTYTPASESSCETDISWGDTDDEATLSHDMGSLVNNNHGCNIVKEPVPPDVYTSDSKLSMKLFFKDYERYLSNRY